MPRPAPVTPASAPPASAPPATASPATAPTAATTPARLAHERAKICWSALGLFFLALTAKSAVATAPAAFLAVVWWKRKRLSRDDWVALTPFFGLGLAAGLFTSWVEKHHVGAQGGTWSLGLLEKAMVAGRVVWFYAGKFFLPINQMFIYPRWEIHAGDAVGWALIAAAAAVPVALWSLRERIGKGPAAALFVYGIMIAPASGFFDVYFMRYSFVQDHFQYFACIGLASLAAALLARVAVSSVGRPALGVDEIEAPGSSALPARAARPSAPFRAAALAVIAVLS